jgi:hypothetical protein
MIAKQYRPLLVATVFALVFYSINKLLFFVPDFSEKYTSYHHSLETIYFFFWCCCTVILIVLVNVNKRFPDNTGYTYMGATLLQMGLSYVMLRPILHSGVPGNSFEKINFFIIFILFLVIETVITIRLLNNKQ